MIEDVYKTKYLKYKQKYLDLKKIEKKLNLKGGNNNKNKLILYKAEWCGFCRQLKPTWDQLKKEFTNISFVEHDADKNPGIMTENNINGYPTIKFEKEGEIIDYNESRNIDNLRNFLKSHN